MPIVADASVAIRGDMSGFHRDLKGAETEVKGLGGRLKSIFSVQNLALGAGLLGISLGIRQISQWAGEAAENFRELESGSRTLDSVFGDSAGVIEDWAARADEAAGLTKREVISSANVIGQTLINMGYDIEDSAEQVVRVQQRAADLAIAYGRDTGDALLGVSALLRGEYDTIEKFGVSIKQADINSRALELGLDLSTDAAKRQATAIAALDLFFEQTEASRGRFLDGADESAVRMQQNGAKFENFMTDTVGPAWNGFLDLLAGIPAGIQDAGNAVGGFLDDYWGPDNIAKVEALADAWGVSFEDAFTRIREAAPVGGELSFESVLDHEIAIIKGKGQELGNEGERLGKDLSRGIHRSEPVVMSAAQQALADPLIVAMLGGKEEAERIAGETPGAIAQALLDAQFDVEDAAAQLASVAEQALHPLIERAQIIAFLSSKELEDGLTSGVPAVRQAARELKEAAEARLRELEGAAWTYGNNVGTSFADGMNAAYGYVIDAAGNLAAATANQIGINSEPKDHASPLYGITKWGGNIVKTIAEGIYGELGTGSAAAAALAGALVPSVGAPVGMMGGTSGGTTVQYILQVDGAPKEIGGRDDVIDAWLQMGSLSDRSLVR